MGRYRKLPVEVEAVQWDGSAEGATRVIDFVLDGGGTARYHDEDELVAVDTPDSTGYLSSGDWAVRGPAGDFYPCKSDIFDATYEAV